MDSIENNLITSTELKEIIQHTVFNGSQPVDSICQTSKNCNTLLHFAVYFSLIQEVVMLLSSSAKTTIVNLAGFTAYDVALDSGDQVIIQIFRRHHEMKNIIINGEASSKIACYSISTVHDQYFDWSDSTRICHLQDLKARIDSDEKTYKQITSRIECQRASSINSLENLHKQLLEKEELICKSIWSNVEYEKKCRDEIEEISQFVQSLKAEIDLFTSTDIMWEDFNVEVFFPQIEHSSPKTLSWIPSRIYIATTAISIFVCKDSLNQTRNVPVFTNLPASCNLEVVIHEEGMHYLQSSHIFATNIQNFNHKVICLITCSHYFEPGENTKKQSENDHSRCSRRSIEIRLSSVKFVDKFLSALRSFVASIHDSILQNKQTVSLSGVTSLESSASISGMSINSLHSVQQLHGVSSHAMRDFKDTIREVSENFKYISEGERSTEVIEAVKKESIKDILSSCLESIKKINSSTAYTELSTAVIPSNTVEDLFCPVDSSDYQTRSALIDYIKYTLHSNRDKRHTAQLRLESFISKREHLLESLRFIQILRTMTQPTLQLDNNFSALSQGNMDSEYQKNSSTTGDLDVHPYSLVDLIMSFHLVGNCIDQRNSLSLTSALKQRSNCTLISSALSPSSSIRFTKCHKDLSSSISPSPKDLAVHPTPNLSQTYVNSSMERLASSSASGTVENDGSTELLISSEFDDAFNRHNRSLFYDSTICPGSLSVASNELRGENDASAIKDRLIYPPPTELLSDFQEATKLLRDMWHCDMGFLAAIQARNAMIEDKVLTISRINYLQNQLLEINRENIKRDELLFEIDL